MRPQGGPEEAENPFADLLDSCVVSDADSADTPQAPEQIASAEVPAEAKPQLNTPAEPGKPQAGTDDAVEAFSAELLLLLAMTGQPATDAKEAKPANDPNAVSGEPAVQGAQGAQSDSDASQPQADVFETAAAPVIPIPPIPSVVAVAASVPVPAVGEVARDSMPVPELASVTPAAAIEVSAKAQVGIETAQFETAPRSAEAIQATLAAHADKNKTLQAEKPSSAAAERTLDTPAAFRSAADTEVPAAKVETPQADTPQADALQPDTAEQTASPAPKDVTAAPTSRADIDAPEAKPKAGTLQPLPDASTNTPVPSAPLQATAGLHQATQPAAVQPDPVANHVPIAGLAVEIAAHAQAGKNRFEIRLDPPELGRIDVRLEVASDGQVTSHLRVERAETLDLLRRDAPMLERALQQAGLKTSDNGLQFSLRDQSFSWQQQQQDREAPNMARLVVPDETLTPVETSRQYGRLVGLGSGVDIRV